MHMLLLLYNVRMRTKDSRNEFWCCIETAEPSALEASSSEVLPNRYFRLFYAKFLLLLHPGVHRNSALSALPTELALPAMMQLTWTSPLPPPPPPSSQPPPPTRLTTPSWPPSTWQGGLRVCLVFYATAVQKKNPASITLSERYTAQGVAARRGERGNEGDKTRQDKIP